ncbi:Ionotropic receptor 177, partial [Hyalella azteca]
MELPVAMNGSALEVFHRTPGCITVAVSAWPPLVDVRPVPFTGSHVSIFRLVMERLKWCYYLLPTPDQQWGDKLNGTWTGMVGMLDRKEADLALGPLGVTLLRTEVVDYAAAYMNSDNNFLYKAITKIQPDMFIFTKPFIDQVFDNILI